MATFISGVSELQINSPLIMCSSNQLCWHLRLPQNSRNRYDIKKIWKRNQGNVRDLTKEMIEKEHVTLNIPDKGSDDDKSNTLGINTHGTTNFIEHNTSYD